MTHPTTPAHTDAELDRLADQITIDVLIEAFSLHGITRRGLAGAILATALSRAIETGDNPS